MKKKIMLILAAVMALSTGVYAASTNYVSSMLHVKDGASLAGESFHIEPHDEIETGSSIVITFHGAVVFSQEVIDGTSTDRSEKGYNGSGYQYKVNGANWNTADSFYDVMPQTRDSRLPYSIKKLNDEQIEVYLCNLPDIYADNSLANINGSGRRPYYDIPIVAYADGIGEVTTTTEAAVNSVKVQMGSNIMYVNDNAVEIDAAPYIQLSSSSAMVPLRAISEALYGGEDTVGWDADTKTVTINYGGNVINFTIGSDIMKINGKAYSKRRQGRDKRRQDIYTLQGVGRGP